MVKGWCLSLGMHLFRAAERGKLGGNVVRSSAKNKPSRGSLCERRAVGRTLGKGEKASKLTRALPLSRPGRRAENNRKGVTRSRRHGVNLGKPGNAMVVTPSSKTLTIGKGQKNPVKVNSSVSLRRYRRQKWFFRNFVRYVDTGRRLTSRQRVKASHSGLRKFGWSKCVGGRNWATLSSGRLRNHEKPCLLKNPTRFFETRLNENRNALLTKIYRLGWARGNLQYRLLTGSQTLLKQSPNYGQKAHRTWAIWNPCLTCEVHLYERGFRMVNGRWFHQPTRRFLTDWVKLVDLQGDERKGIFSFCHRLTQLPSCRLMDRSQVWTTAEILFGVENRF